MDRSSQLPATSSRQVSGVATQAVDNGTLVGRLSSATSVLVRYLQLADEYATSGRTASAYDAAAADPDVEGVLDDDSLEPALEPELEDDELGVELEVRLSVR